VTTQYGGGASTLRLALQEMKVTSGVNHLREEKEHIKLDSVVHVDGIISVFIQNSGFS
jgi:hypothetical protein